MTPIDKQRIAAGTDAIEAHEAAHWPDGKEAGGKGQRGRRLMSGPQDWHLRA